MSIFLRNFAIFVRTNILYVHTEKIYVHAELSDVCTEKIYICAEIPYMRMRAYPYMRNFLMYVRRKYTYVRNFLIYVRRKYTYMRKFRTCGWEPIRTCGTFWCTNGIAECTDDFSVCKIFYSYLQNFSRNIVKIPTPGIIRSNWVNSIQF